MKLINAFVIALQMYTRIPMPQVDWSEENRKYALCFFPVAGVILGGLFLLVAFGDNLVTIRRYSYLHEIRPALYVALSLLPLVFTGGIHLDGFMDTVDALSSHQSREKKLLILKDTHTGAFSVMYVAAYLILYAAIISRFGLHPRAIAIIALGFVASRALSAFQAVTLPPARADGMLNELTKPAGAAAVRIASCIWLLLAIGGMARIAPVSAALVTAAMALATVYFVRVAKKQFGGTTGDLSGFYLQVLEISIAAAECIAMGVQL